jgi:hypothetical protein
VRLARGRIFHELAVAVVGRDEQRAARREHRSGERADAASTASTA